MAKLSIREQNRRIALSGLLVALMLVLGFIESLIPVGSIPGIKLGLSNGVLIFAIYMLNIPTAFLLMVLKVVLSGLLFGGVSAMMYAFAGGMVSMICMSLLSRVKDIHPVTVSMVGGVAHNVGQVGLAMIMLHTPKLLYYMAILMLIGLLCGALTGVCATGVMKHLKHIQKQG
ncbi:MAG: Gx transporter family protein [Clostridia bacterium]|nr:Gx transporter family protein [Clostridia bacterium]